MGVCPNQAHCQYRLYAARGLLHLIPRLFLSRYLLWASGYLQVGSGRGAGTCSCRPSEAFLGATRAEILHAVPTSVRFLVVQLQFGVGATALSSRTLCSIQKQPMI
eukprot:1025206-Rhodomonas_salina.1